MVGAYINIMKTTLGFNFYLDQAFKQHKYTKTWKQREAVNKDLFIYLYNVKAPKKTSNTQYNQSVPVTVLTFKRT